MLPKKIRLALLRTDRAFGRFVLTRALFLCSALSAPYYVLLGKSNAQEGSWALGVFVIAGGLAAGILTNVPHSGV